LISLGPRARQRELLGDKFIQNDSTPWRTLTVVLFSLRRRIGWQWGVKGFDRLSEPRHSEFTDQIGRNRLPKVSFSQSVPDRCPQCRLTNPSNGGIYRHQSVGQWRAFIIGPHGRMNHFKTEEAPAHQTVG
jgi:hypothetical protein